MSITDINKTLAEMPALIAKTSEQAEESRFLWQESKVRLKQQEAKIYLQTKAQEPDAKVGELDALVNASQELYEQRLAVVSHESEYRKLDAQITAYSEALMSAKCMAKLKLGEMASMPE